MWTSAVRLRWYITRLIVASVGLYILYCFAADMPLLSDKLPRYSGPHAVGTMDLELPCERRNLSNVILKETGQPAFQLETVLFSLFYPAVNEARSLKPKHLWIADTSREGQGYARFAGMSNVVTDSIFSAALWTLAGSTTIPARVDVPLEDTAHVSLDVDYSLEKPLNDYGLPQFPIVIFSHGMASSRTSYTQFCGELASRGYVVAAVEHRDGSAPGTTVSTVDGQSRTIFHISEDQLEPQPTTLDFKVMQLAMRQAEVEETVRVLRLINDGFGGDLYHLNSRKEGTDLAEWVDRLDMNRVVMAGHSYGATLALQVLNGTSAPERPFTGGIVLDPGKESGPLNDNITVPLLVINSQSWSSKFSIFFGSPHFDVVKALVTKALDENKGKFAWFLTSKGTTHPSVTDAPLIEPTILSWTTGSTVDVREGLLQYVTVAHDFMRYIEDGHRRGVLAEAVTHPKYDEDARSEERKKSMPKNIAKFWQVHVAPDPGCPFPGLCGVDPD